MRAAKLTTVVSIVDFHRADAGYVKHFFGEPFDLHVNLKYSFSTHGNQVFNTSRQDVILTPLDESVLFQLFQSALQTLHAQSGNHPQELSGANRADCCFSQYFDSPLGRDDVHKLGNRAFACLNKDVR